MDEEVVAIVREALERATQTDLLPDPNESRSDPA